MTPLQEARAKAAQAEEEAAAAEARAAAASARVHAIRSRPRGTRHDRCGAADISADIVEMMQTPRAGHRWRRWRKRRAVVAIAAAALICASVATSGLILWQHRNAVQERRHGAEFADAARQDVVVLMSLDFHTAKQDVQRAIDCSTGDFRKNFEASAEDLVKRAQDSKVVTTTSVNATAVESMTEDSAVILVAASSKATNSAGADQEPHSWRLAVTMQRERGQLKMSKIEFIS